MRLRRASFFKGIFMIVMVVILGVVAFLQHPLFGQVPKGERLEEIKHSAHFSNGVFQNQIPSPMRTQDQSELSLWMENLFGKKGQVRPPQAVPSIKTDLKALDVNVDTAVWMGHSSWYLQLAGKRILVDPVFSTHAAPVPFVVKAFEGSNLYSAEDMPPIDVMLISHDHYDHLDYATAKALKDKVAQVITGLGVGAHLQRWGYDMDKVHEQDWYNEVELGNGLKLVAAPARHFSGRTLKRNQSLWLGFALLSPGRRVFLSGDSGYGPHFAEFGQKYGPFDWISLDTGQYDVRWANVHMNPEQAAQAASDLRTQYFTPGHIGRFSISRHDWDDPFKRISQASVNRDYVLITPLIGQAMVLDKPEESSSAWWEALH